MTARHVLHRTGDVVVAPQRLVLPHRVVSAVRAAANECCSLAGFVAYDKGYFHG
jgi:hypothetical protein